MKLLPILISAGLFASVAARGEEDHDRARRAVLDGRALPLEAILERARAAYGDCPVISTEIEGHGEEVIYEIRLLTADGRVLMLKYDGRDGTLLKVRGSHAGEHR